MKPCPTARCSRLDRITVDPAICHGKPTIRGVRMTVQTILDLLASGMTYEEVLADYPYLQRGDLLAALEYGAVASSSQQVISNLVNSIVGRLGTPCKRPRFTPRPSRETPPNGR